MFSQNKYFYTDIGTRGEMLVRAHARVLSVRAASKIIFTEQICAAGTRYTKFRDTRMSIGIPRHLSRFSSGKCH